MTIVFVWLCITIAVVFVTGDIELALEWPLSFLWVLVGMSFVTAILFLMVTWAIGFAVADAILGPNRYRW